MAVVAVELCKAAAVAAMVPATEVPESAAELIVGRTEPLRIPMRLPEVPAALEITLGFAVVPARYPEPKVIAPTVTIVDAVVPAPLIVMPVWAVIAPAI